MLTVEQAKQQGVCRVCLLPMQPGEVVDSYTLWYAADPGDPSATFPEHCHKRCHNGVAFVDPFLAATRLLLGMARDAWLKSLPGGEWHAGEGDSTKDPNQPYQDYVDSGPGAAASRRGVSPGLVLGTPRAPGWEKLAKDFLADNPHCAVCGTKGGVVPHHVVPVHVDKSHELDESNLITLCPVHHLWWGHLGNWASWNVDVRKDADEWSHKIAHRPTPTKKAVLSDPDVNTP